LKYGIQRLVIEVPQNFLDKRQEFIKLVEWTPSKHSFQIPEKPDVWEVR
jgi:hypothetical protein